MAGYEVRVLRPYPILDNSIWWCNYEELPVKARSTSYAVDLLATELEASAEKERAAGRMPLTVAGYVQDGGANFAVVFGANTKKVEWKLTIGSSSTELKTKAEELAAKGFRPSCVTAYPFDGAVRYCVVG